MAFTITKELTGLSCSLTREKGNVGGPKAAGGAGGEGGAGGCVEEVSAEYQVIVAGTAKEEGPKSIRGARAAAEQLNNTAIKEPGDSGQLFFSGCDVSYETGGLDDDGEVTAIFSGTVQLTSKGVVQNSVMDGSAAAGGGGGGGGGGGTLSPQVANNGTSSSTITMQQPKPVHNACGDPIGPLFVTKHLTKITMVDYQQVDASDPNANHNGGKAGAIDDDAAALLGMWDLPQIDDGDGNMVDQQFHNTQHDMGPAEFSSFGGGRQKRTRSWVTGKFSPVMVENLGYYECASKSEKTAVMLKLPDGSSIPSTVPITVGPPIKVEIMETK